MCINISDIGCAYIIILTKFIGDGVMTTATFGEVAKLIGTNVDRLRENDKVCLFCDAIQLVAIMIAPLLLPIGIIYGTYIGGF